MGQANLIDIVSQTYDIGRSVIFRAPFWDGTTDLLDALTHLGNTEGEVTPEPNTEFSSLMLPENLGPAPLKVYMSGEAPTIEVGLFMNPTLLSIVNPTAGASGGYVRQVRVTEHTLWIAPEQLFIKREVDGSESEVDISIAGGVRTKDGSPFTAEDTRLWNLGIFFWRGYFERAMPTYRHEDGGKSLRTVTFHAMPDLTKPNGHNLWTTGAGIAASGIDLEGASS